jgi:nucleotide-binding universal stress UspA family protein
MRAIAAARRALVGWPRLVTAPFGAPHEAPGPEYLVYKRILVTHDGSDLADAALDHAATLAKATAAPVLVLQVVDSVAQILAQTASFAAEPAAAGAVAASVAEEAVHAQQAAAQENLDAVKAALERAGVTKVDTMIMEGSPGDAVVACAEEQGCDLIIIATHGRSGLKRAILGSVADHVARHTPHSAVLLIRPSEAGGS